MPFLSRAGRYLADHYELIPQLIIVGGGVVVGVVFSAWNGWEFYRRDKEPVAPFVGMNSDVAPPLELATVPPRDRDGKLFSHK